KAYLVKNKTPESPHTVAPPTRHAEDPVDFDMPGARAIGFHRTTFTRSPTYLCFTHLEVEAMSDSVFRKRFWSSYESSPSSSPLDLSSKKCYRCTSKLVEDKDEEDDEDEDEEVEESLDSDSESEDAEDEGPTAKDDDIAAGDAGLTAGDEGPGMRVEILSLGGDEAVPEGQQRAASVMEIAMAPSIVPSPISSSMIPLIIPSPVASPATAKTGDFDWVGTPASPATAETEGFLIELGSRVEMQGGLIHDHMVQLGELSPALFKRYERDIGEFLTRSGEERVAVTFGAILRPVLALKSWAGQTDAQRADLWHAISDTQMENGELRLQIIEERHARLDLAEIVDRELSPALFKRSLKHEQERVVVTFRAIWRPVLALESWVSQTDAQREALWHAISDTQMKNRELQLQIIEERHARLDLAEIVDSMRRGQEPRRDV
nr:hypothetical protein [Tanacetum cinerariifolium]